MSDIAPIKKILIVTGTRPNFVKVTQFRKSAAAFPGLQVEIVHTGQHFDENMSEVFFRQFKLKPDHFLNIPGGSPISQVASIMERLEKLIETAKPDLLMVVGDVNSTLAGALTANKMGIPLAHLESGLRSNDRTMPEEINRILTDEISDYCFVTEPSGMDHLLASGKQIEQLFMVGNTMIDTLVAFQDEIAQNRILDQMNISNGNFVLMTIHRPATVDHPEKLLELLKLMEWLLQKVEIVFPIHPRTIQNLKKYNLYERFTQLDKLHFTEPLGYFDFQKLVSACTFVLTDSGGIQEETTFLQKPCLTLRPNTERPVTITEGTNTLVNDWDHLHDLAASILDGTYKKGSVPHLWDGFATQRILKILAEVL